MIEIRNEKHFKKVFSKKIVLDEKISDKYNVYVDDTGYEDFNDTYFDILREIRYILEEKLTGEIYGLFFSYKVNSIDMKSSYTSNLFKVNKINVFFLKVENINLKYDIGYLSSNNYCYKKELTSLKYRKLKKYLKVTTVTLKSYESGLNEENSTFKDVNSYLKNIFICNAYNAIINDKVDIYDETSIFEGMNIHVYATKELKDNVVFKVSDGENHIGNCIIPSEVVNIKFSISIPGSDNIVNSESILNIPKSFTKTLYDLIVNK